jgi:hypothetical protein
LPSSHSRYTEYFLRMDHNMSTHENYFWSENKSSGSNPIAGGDQRATPQERNNRREVPSLRPPTLMIDLLFGALMLFALNMGNPNAQRIVSKTFDLPSNSESADKDQLKLAALKPIQGANGNWLYEIVSGRRLSAAEVKAWAKEERKTPVLVVTKSVSVQSYLDAEEPLRKLGLKVGLAVERESEVTK